MNSMGRAAKEEDWRSAVQAYRENPNSWDCRTARRLVQVTTDVVVQPISWLKWASRSFWPSHRRTKLPQRGARLFPSALPISVQNGSSGYGQGELLAASTPRSRVIPALARASF